MPHKKNVAQKETRYPKTQSGLQPSIHYNSYNFKPLTKFVGNGPIFSVRV